MAMRARTTITIAAQRHVQRALVPVQHFAYRSSAYSACAKASAMNTIIRAKFHDDIKSKRPVRKSEKPSLDNVICYTIVYDMNYPENFGIECDREGNCNCNCKGGCPCNGAYEHHCENYSYRHACKLNNDKDNVRYDIHVMGF